MLFWVDQATIVFEFFRHVNFGHEFHGKRFRFVQEVLRCDQVIQTSGFCDFVNGSKQLLFGCPIYVCNGGGVEKTLLNGVFRIVR